MSTAPASSVIYVSPAGSDDWSGCLAQPNADGTDGPLATLAAARDAARPMTKSAEAPLTVRLSGGRYRISEPLVFTPDDSFVTYAADDGETAVIDAGWPVSGWREETIDPAGDGREVAVWTADVSDVIERVGVFRQLFVNGRRARRSRLPKEGYYWVEYAEGTDVGPHPRKPATQKDHFVAGSGDWRAFRNLTDVDVCVMHWWHDDRRGVKSYDEPTRTVTLKEPLHRPFIDDMNQRFARYYVDNVYEGLSSGGEWYLDRPAKKLYYVPREGERIEAAEAFAPGPSGFVSIEGDAEAERYVEGVAFRGVVFEHSDWRDYNRASQSAGDTPGTITLHGARRCAFEDCEIRHVGNYAFDIQDGCTSLRIIGCTIEDIGAGGIKVNGSDARGARSRRTGRNIISDNHIHALGRVHHGAAGITLKHTFGNLVSHNHLHDLYYTGISCGWVWGYSESVCRDNRIEKNHLHHIGQGQLNDMGAIYLLGVSPGTAIRGNHIHDVKSYKYGGWAVYPDEGSSHLVIENNVCHDCSSQLFHLHFGRESAIRNNVWAFAGEGIIAISRGNLCDWPEKGCVPDGRVTNAFTFERNVVITDGAPVFLGGMEKWIGDGSGSLRHRNFISDLNVFFDVGGRDVWVADGGHLIAEEGYDETWTFDQWREMGNDAHSVVADPKCRDIAARDFSLAGDSPAFALGFRAIDLSDVGPRPKDQRTFHESYLGRRTESKR
jgi:hypothetical protein